ncbi:uncharacterized protein LOC143431087 [Xylocopa sonorina]|uniref:uncharacterized protein LOC143431087 n=1 Tax=Xylocopa sonorina TaxID=1818115 RepID=UPI00403AC330
MGQRCALMTVDIKNAFNTIRWRNILITLRKHKISKYLRDVIAIYLSNRSIRYYGKKETIIADIYGGIQQGSIVGPLMLNLGYDIFQKIKTNNNITIIGYADDTAIIGPREIEFKLKENLKIKSSYDIKYLGVTLDTRIKYNKHVEIALNKANKTIMSMAWLMSNLRGRVLYVTPTWAKTCEIKGTKYKLKRYQKIVLLRTNYAYRTISIEAANVISRQPPIELIIQGRERIYEINRKLKDKLKAKEITEREMKKEIESKKKMIKEEITQKWQKEWEETKKAVWTRILIPTIKSWLEKGNITIVNHSITQLLTGYGCFNAYRKRIKKISHQKCRHYDGEVDDPEHTIFDCVVWNGKRMELERLITPNTAITKNNLMELITKNKETREAFGKRRGEAKLRRTVEEEQKREGRE